MKLVLRQMEKADSRDLAVLCDELGYPSSPEQCSTRIKALENRSDQKMFGAIDSDRLVGFLHARINDLLELDRQAEVAALVVLESYRGRGVGKLLMSAAEDWARDKAETIVLRSRTTRTEAHRFYESLGYTINKTSYTLSKSIKAERPD